MSSPQSVPYATPSCPLFQSLYRPSAITELLYGSLCSQSPIAHPWATKSFPGLTWYMLGILLLPSAQLIKLHCLPLGSTGLRWALHGIPWGSLPSAGPSCTLIRSRGDPCSPLLLHSEPLKKRSPCQASGAIFFWSQPPSTPAMSPSISTFLGRVLCDR